MKLSKEQLINILSPLDPVQIKETDIEIKCPECGHRECGISITEEGHPWGCYRSKKCGATGNLYTLKKFGITFGKSEKTTSDFEIKPIKVFSYQEEELILPNEKLPLGFKRVYKDDYLDSRGFNSQDYEYWEVGRTSIGLFRNYVIFPIRDSSGENKAYVSRALKKDFNPKYKNSISEFGSLLGGSEKFDSCQTVIINEGIFDSINITRILDLYDCEDLRSVCTFGAKISRNQINILKNKQVESIILMFDADVIKKIKPIAFELAMSFEVKIALLEDEQEIDAGDCNFEQLERAFNNLQSPLDFFLNRLD